MWFFSKKRKDVASAVQRAISATDVSRYPGEVPALELHRPRPLLDRQTFAGLLSGGVSSAHTQVTNETRRTVPASLPVVEFGIPTFKPAPPHSRFVQKRASGQDL